MTARLVSTLALLGTGVSVLAEYSLCNQPITSANASGTYQVAVDYSFDSLDWGNASWAMTVSAADNVNYETNSGAMLSSLWYNTAGRNYRLVDQKHCIDHP